MKKGVVLVVVMGVMLVIFTLALAALFLMTQESRIAEHKIKRTRAFFAAQAGMVLALERLRKDPGSGGWIPNNTYCINGGAGCTATVIDTDIPYNVQIDISALGGGSMPIAGTSQVDINVVY